MHPLVGIDVRPLLSRKTGIGFYVWHLLDALARVEHEFRFLLYTTNRVRLPKTVEGDGRFTVRMMPKVPGILAVQTMVPLDLSARGAHLFHGTNYQAPLLSPCPVVLSVHDLTTLSMPEAHRWANRAGHSLLPTLIRRARMILTDAECTRQALIEGWGLAEERVVAIPLAAGAVFHRPVSGQARQRVLRRYRLPSPFILFVGTLEPRKNLAGLFRAYALVVRRHRLPHRLVLVGPMGWGVGRTMQLPDQLGIRQRVHLTGYVPTGDLPAIYATAELLVYPSLEEGFGLPPLEAMAVGTPVITSDRSSMPEVVDGAAVTVNPEDVEALAEAIAQVAGDAHLRERLSHLGRKRARSFRWEETARRTLQVYRQALTD